MNKTIFLSLIFLSINMAACRNTGSDGSSKIKHQDNEGIAGNNSWLYHNTNQAEYFLLQGLLHDGKLTTAKEYIETDHKLNTFFEKWVKKFHANIIAQQPEAANIPLPVVQIAKKPQINAYVAPMPICIKNTVINFGYTQSVLTKPSKVDVLHGSFEYSTAPCIEKEYTKEEITEILNFHLGDDCAMSVSEENMTFIATPKKSECDFELVKHAYSNNPQPIVYATSNYITFYSKLILKMTEQQVLGILGHELAHYYRGHAVTKKHDIYNYFYDIKNRTAPGRPTEVDSWTGDIVTSHYKAYLSVQKEANDYKYKLQQIDTPGIYQDSKKLKLHTSLFQKLDLLRKRTYDGNLCRNRQNLPDSCRDSLCSRQTIPLAKTPTLTKKVENDLKKIEPMWLSCLKELNPEETKIEELFSELSLDGRLQDYYELPRQNEFLNSRDYLLDINLQIKANYPAYSPKKLAELIMVVNQEMRDLKYRLEQTWSTLTAAANELLLGHFSTEQEADELAAEWLSDLKIDPDVTIMAMSGLIANLAERAKCLEGFENAWVDANGMDRFIPIGSLRPHHNTCFRMFNIYHDIRNHGYDQITQQKHEPEDWEEITKGLVEDPTAQRSKDKSSNKFARYGIGCNYEPEATPVENLLSIPAHLNE